MYQNQNGISSRFSSRFSSPKFCFTISPQSPRTCDRGWRGYNLNNRNLKMALGKVLGKHRILSAILICSLFCGAQSCFSRGGADDPCRTKQSGKAAHPEESCPSKKYIECKNNQGKAEKDCPISGGVQQHFNPKTEDCDWPSEVDCNGGMSTSTTTATTTTTTTTTTVTTIMVRNYLS